MSWWDYWALCPICSAPQGKPCRTLATGRVTDRHTTRPAARGGDSR